MAAYTMIDQCIPGGTTSSTSTSKATTSSTRTTLTTSTRTTSTTSAVSSSSTVDPCALKYLITFGDSYSQTGFDINGNKPSSSNPLGNPALPGWTASGGLNWVGFLASQYNTSTLLAYNFAYGGATTNATIVPPFQSTVLSFIDQVAQFSGSIAKKPSYAPWGDNALFGVWIGVNDVGNTWWKSDYDQIVNQIMDSYFGQLQILYDAGARNFMLLTVPRKCSCLWFPCLEHD
jgi:phospholipase/lecithinase/hemolysin